MQMLHLGYSKFIQINAKDQKVLWILHYIKENASFCFTGTLIT